ncbi:cytochrome P450 [Streptomyces sp. NPDC004647]|uniref:cytochrome P450 n=1 Tax=Streptomyces sp. NPDC004647 TaxID=3154671 RepID=UPI0033A6DA6D
MPAPVPELPLARLRTAPLDPPPEYLHFRAASPITRVTIWDGKLSAWLVTRWEDARAVLASRAFSADVSHPGFPRIRDGVPLAPNGFLQHHDPPVHTRMRHAVTAEFMDKPIKALRPSITRIATDLIDEMTRLEDKAPVDLVEHFALPLPSRVIFEFLGVPYEDQAFMQAQSNTFIELGSTPDQLAFALETLHHYFLELLAAKRQRPGDDTVTRLGAQVDTRTLTAKDAADLACLILFTGYETTASMIALSVIALLQNPSQIPRLLARSDKKSNSVDELLRYLSIFHAGQRRYALEDVTIGGVTIRAGEGVIIPLAVANRDPEVFTDPDHLDLRRGNARRHVAFGHGIHVCLGKPLARAELQIALPLLFRRLPNLKIAVPLEEVSFKLNTLSYGVHELPITW